MLALPIVNPPPWIHIITGNNYGDEGKLESRDMCADELRSRATYMFNIRQSSVMLRAFRSCYIQGGAILNARNVLLHCAFGIGFLKRFCPDMSSP